MVCVQSDNPGVWPFHCHMDAHFVIGQSLYIAASPELLQSRPDDLPTCPATCTYQEGPWSVPYVNQRYGNLGI